LFSVRARHSSSTKPRNRHRYQNFAETLCDARNYPIEGEIYSASAKNKTGRIAE
jgi:hypothetical protein